MVLPVVYGGMVVGTASTLRKLGRLDNWPNEPGPSMLTLMKVVKKFLEDNPEFLDLGSGHLIPMALVMSYASPAKGLEFTAMWTESMGNSRWAVISRPAADILLHCKSVYMSFSDQV